MADEGISIDIAGLTDVKAMLEDLGTKAGERCIRTALRAGAAIEQAAIEERAPVKDTTGGSLPDGALAADITISMTRSDQGNIAAIVQPGKLTRHVANWVEYGHRLVHGGRSRLLANGKTRGPGTQIGTVPAHPFIRPAYEATADQVAKTIADVLADEVTKAANRKK
jgi:HK97 gp10 family phage protein